MSLPPELWQVLGVAPAAVQSRRRFFSSFVELKPPPYDRRALADLLAETPPRRREDSVVNLLSGHDDAALNLMRQLLPPTTPAAPDRWVPVAERADALREAAIAALLIDIDAGRILLQRAGREYNLLGLPFGAFLTVAATGEPGDPAIVNELATLVGFDDLPGFTSQRRADLNVESDLLDPRSVLATPEQQMFLLLTVAAGAEGWPDGLLEAVANSAQRRRSAVVGSLAQPLSVWWETAHLIAQMAAGSRDARPILREHLTGLAQAHGQQLAFAQQDEYNWQRAMARVDLVDLDLVGAVAQSARVLRRRQLPRWRLGEEFSALPPLARVSLTVGLQLGGGGLAYEDEPWDPNPSPYPADETERHVD